MKLNGTMESEEARFSTLIWRSIRLKWIILIAMLALLWVIWVALASGRQRIVKLQQDFVHQSPTTASALKSAGISEDDLGDPGVIPKVAAFIELQRRFESFFISGVPKDTDVPMREELGRIERFQRQVKNTYRVKITVPYLTDALEVDTTFIADAWPFAVLLLLSLVASIGLRQRSYEILLASLVRESVTKRPQTLGLAQFLVGIFEEGWEEGRRILFYKRPLPILPEPLVSGILVGAVLLSSLRMIAYYNPTLLHPTSSIIFSYYFLIWTALVVVI